MKIEDISNSLEETLWSYARWILIGLQIIGFLWLSIHTIVLREHFSDYSDLRFTVTCLELGNTVVQEEDKEWNRGCYKDGTPWYHWRRE